MNLRKKILITSARLPYPPIAGGILRNYMMITTIAKHFDVHLVAITDNSIPEDFYTWTNNIGITYKIFRKPKHKFLINLFRYFSNKAPLQVNYYKFNDVAKYIDSIYSAYDLFFTILIRTAPYIINKPGPKIIDLVDAISLHYQTAQKQKSSTLKWKIIYFLEQKRVLFFEYLCIKKFDVALLVDKNDLDFYKDKKVCYLTNGVREEIIQNDSTLIPKYANHIVFFGKMDYQPNLVTVKWIIDKILPYLNPNIKFLIIGAFPTANLIKEIKKYPNVTITGYIKDPYQIIKSSLCVLSPMQIGGGVQNKVLESMALGTINIVSSIAAKAINAINAKDLFIIDDPKQIIDKINNIYKNPDKYNNIKINSKNFILNNFSNAQIEVKLVQLINHTINAKSADNI